jgi:hypothetical protein
MNSLNRKLTELENNTVSDEIDEETTHLDYSDFPEAEKELHHYTRQILNSKEITDLSANEKELIEKSAILLSKRVFTLFNSTLQQFCCIKEKSGYEMNYQLRSGWFMSECLKLGKQSLEMELLEHENEGLNEDDLDAKMCELEAKQPELFTQDSFNEYESRMLRNMAERIQVKKAEATV